MLRVGILVLALSGAQAQESPRMDDPQLMSVCFEVTLQELSKTPFRGEVKLTRNVVSEPDAKSDEVSIVVEAGRKACVSLPSGSAWDAQIGAPGFWVRRFVLAVGSSGPQVQQLEAWPLGRVVGQLVSSERPPSFPKKLILTTLPARSSAKNRKSPKGEIECPIDREGRFRCEVPAATYDLSIFAEAFIPLYSWDVSVPGGGESDLKTLTLRRGASLAGWVESAAGEIIDPERCRVTLSPIMASGVGDIGAIEKLKNTEREAKVNARGFFQFVGLAPGSYTVGAVQEGALAEPRGPILVAGGGETYLPKPFLLEAPFDLELVVEPARDWLGRSWTIRVERSFGPGDPRSSTVFEGTTSEEGIARVPRQKRGIFSVQISDSAGQRMHTEFDLAFDSPADARRVFEVPWIELKGRIQLGEQPLRATIWFGGKSGGASIRLESDEEGRFSGALSRDGHWRIEIAATTPSLALEIHRTIEARKGRAEIEIELPNSRIFGRVVGASAQAETEAVVSLLESDGASQILFADKSGRFEFRGVMPGNLTLGAETRRGGLSSDEHVLGLAKDAEVGPIELLLKDHAKYSGRVLSARGAEGNAAVTVMGMRPVRHGNSRVRTSADGGFVAKLPTSVEGAIAVVSALGSALTVFELRPGQAADLFVQDVGGTVEVDFGIPLGRRITEGDAWLMLFQNDLELPVQTVADWARAHGVPFSDTRISRVSEIAPGEYTACVVPLLARLDLVRTGWSPKLAVECRSGQLSPGGTLRLAFGKSEEKTEGKPADGS